MDEGIFQNQGLYFIRYFLRMWKAIGNIKTGQEASIRSNRSRYDINVEPFHEGLKRQSNVSPDKNRSFCHDYFEKKRNKSVKEEVVSSKSQKKIISGGSNQDIFTQLRKKATKEEQGSRITQKGKQNPQTQKRRSKKNYQQLKMTSSRIYTLKKDQMRLKNTIQNEFTAFKNMFLQLQQHMHQHQNNVTLKQPTPMPLDQLFLQEILGEAMGIERYFQQMDRKKAALMQRLTQ